MTIRWSSGNSTLMIKYFTSEEIWPYSSSHFWSHPYRPLVLGLTNYSFLDMFLYLNENVCFGMKENKKNPETNTVGAYVRILAD